MSQISSISDIDSTFSDITVPDSNSNMGSGAFIVVLVIIFIILCFVVSAGARRNGGYNNYNDY